MRSNWDQKQWDDAMFLWICHRIDFDPDHFKEENVQLYNIHRLERNLQDSIQKIGAERDTGLSRRARLQTTTRASTMQQRRSAPGCSLNDRLDKVTNVLAQLGTELQSVKAAQSEQALRLDRVMSAFAVRQQSSFTEPPTKQGSFHQL